ncbi:hypothetical protein QBC40DRAFT_238416 [Triangularia verruculosa]|uniref:Uncharacterized protein n=1 Tax=Triangularia verruculosa TaxID=2587418 RepID=A0AAN6X5M4_9PEZI|nr:hypothetical protein QBC40DRAFT_238416 [Triangularia verruculosa]
MDLTEDQMSPYQKGSVLEIRLHVPPLPFGFYYSAYPREERVELWTHEDRVAFALAHPPFDDVPPDPNPEFHTFTIVEDKTQRSSQEQPFGEDGSDQAPLLLAKVYDGVGNMTLPESGLREDYNDINDIDGMLRADSDYSIEAGAFEILTTHDNISGKVVPRYYGCWTFPLEVSLPELPEGQSVQRWVRMILMEFIKGESTEAKINRARNPETRKFQYDLLPPESVRLHVLRQLVETEILLWWEVGLTHQDFAPRNVMIREDNSVVVIDFYQVRITTYLKNSDGKTPKERADDPKLPVSPIETYWPFRPSWSFFLVENAAGGCWGTGYFNGGMEMTAEWLIETWSDDDRYAPPSEEFLNHVEHMVRSPKIINMLEDLGRAPAASEGPSSIGQDC